MTPLAAYLLLFVAVGIGFIFVHLLAGKFMRPNNPNAAKATTYECGEPTIGSSWIQFDLRFYVVALLFVIFDVEVAFFFPWAVVFGKANALAAIGEPTSPEGYHEIAERATELMPPSFQAQKEIQFNRQRLLDVTSKDLTNLRELRDKKRTVEEKRKPLENKSKELSAKRRPLDDKKAKAKDQTLSADDEKEFQRLQLSAQEKKELHDINLTDKDATDLDRLTTPASLAVETQLRARRLAWLALLEIAVFFGVLLVGFAYLWRRGDLAWVRSLAAERTAGGPTA